MAVVLEQLELPGGLRLVRDEVYGFLKVMPRPTDEEIASYYANAYRNPCVPHDPKGRADLVCEFSPRPGRVLEIGCGAGEFHAEFARRGWEVLGVEPGPQYAEQARRRGVTVVEEPLQADSVGRLGTFDAAVVARIDRALRDALGLAGPEQA